jgi:hypothetical protein
VRCEVRVHALVPFTCEQRRQPVASSSPLAVLGHVVASAAPRCNRRCVAGVGRSLLSVSVGAIGLKGRAQDAALLHIVRCLVAAPRPCGG